MSARIQLKNVRLSFPSLFHRESFDGKEGKFAATFLINKEDTKTIGAINSAIEAALAEAKIKVAKDKICLRDGDDSEYEGYAGHMSIKAATNKRPTLINRDKTPISEDDGILYAGCYVNAIIDVWVQNNGFGKRVNANLHGVQFVRDGASFVSGSVDVTDEFDSFDDFDTDEPF